jgi:hypothetical protein
VRLFCELFLAAVLIWLGWTKSFHDRIDQIRGIQPAAAAQQTQVRETSAAATTTTTTSVPRQPFLPGNARVRPSSTPSGDWMWDPSHRSTLDRPAYNPKDASHNYQDAGHQSYWIDNRGVRHYNSATPPPGSSP